MARELLYFDLRCPASDTFCCSARTEDTIPLLVSFPSRRCCLATFFSEIYTGIESEIFDIDIAVLHWQCFRIAFGASVLRWQ